MEQATAGKAPPSIAINSGGGIQILNMNAVRAATVGATVVPSPGSAQTATVVGSPGPPGKGPRMIIGPQQMSMSMLANRPGQPVDESDSGGVNASDELNTNTEQSCSPASITGVSCDLLADSEIDDECEEVEIKDVKIISETGYVNASDIHVEGNNRIKIGESQRVDANDLSRSPTDDKLSVLGSPRVSNERSDNSSPPHHSHPISPSFSGENDSFQLGSNQSMDCDENENHELKYVPEPSPSDDSNNTTLISYTDRTTIRGRKTSSSCNDHIESSSVAENISIRNTSPLGYHDDGAQEIDRVDSLTSDYSRDRDTEKESNFRLKENNDTDVPAPASVSDSLPSDVIVDSDKESQKCVQPEKMMDSERNSTENCDSAEKSVVIVSPLAGDREEDSASMTKCDSEPPPLVHHFPEAGGNNRSVLTRGDSSSNSGADHGETVDDLNLEMFADQAEPELTSSGGEGPPPVVGKSSTATGLTELSPRNRSDDDKSNENNPEEEPDDNRPKLMDMNLADFMFLNSDDEDNASKPWSNTRLAAPVEQTYSPPKITQIPSLEVTVTTASSEVVTTPQSSSTTATSTATTTTTSWDRTRSGNSNSSEPAPACAFQMYTIGQGQSSSSSNSLAGSGNRPQIAARIPMRSSEPHNQLNQHYLQSAPLRQSQPNVYNTGNNNPPKPYVVSGPSGVMPNPNSINHAAYQPRANNSTIETEYKGPPNPRCFTNDPQLHSQFLQFTRNFPLAAGSTDKTDGIRQVQSGGIPIRGQYQQQQQPAQVPTTQHSKPFPASNSPRNPVVAPQPRPPYVVASQQHFQQLTPQQNPQQHFHSAHPTTSTTSVSFSRTNIRLTTNGCDNTKQVYNMQQVSPGYHHSSYPGQPTVTNAGVRPAASNDVGGFRSITNMPNPHHNPSTALAQRHQMQPSKDLPSCSYNTTGQTSRFQSPPTSSNYNNLHQPGVQQGYPHLGSSTHGGSGSGFMGYPPRIHHQQQGASVPPTRPHMTQLGTPQQSSSAPQSSLQHGPTMQPSSHIIPSMNPYSKMPGTGTSAPGAWNVSAGSVSRASMPSRMTVPTSARSASISTYPYPPQNLGAREAHVQVQRPQQQVVHRPPYQDTSIIHAPAGSQQYRQRPPGYVLESRPQVPQVPAAQRVASMTPRFPSQQGSGSVQGQGIYAVGNNSKWNESMHQGHPRAPVSSSSSVPSPQMLRNPHFIAHFNKNPSIGEQQDSSSMVSQPVIRPHIYSGGSVVTTSYNCSTTSTVVGAHSSSSSSSSGSNCSPSSNIRPFYGNQYQQFSTSTAPAAASHPHYYSNQASVIRAAPQGSISNSSISNSQSASGTCSMSERRGSGSGYPPGSYPSAGYTGELTLQSFLSNPSAPFMCPPSSASSSSPSERSASGSGYFKESMGWGGGDRPYREGDVSEDYPYSSCQYSDAMRRYNAPITLQALSGLPPGANHLLVKTENGQFQLVSVRTAAAPGTPVVPSTAAPTTSMSIAQQLPSNSPLAPPSLPPHSAPSGPPHPPPNSVITTSTIPPHPSQQGRIITSSSSNHIVTSWSSTPINSVVNNSATSSPLPIPSSTAPIPHPPRLAPPPLPSSSLVPPSTHPSVIMPPNLSASNSQLITATGPSGSVTFSNPAAAAEFAFNHLQQQQRASHPVVVSSGGGQPPPPPVGVPPPPLPNSLSSVPPPPINSIPGSVIRGGGLAANLPPPPPVVVNTTSNSVSSSTPTGATLPNTNLPPPPPTSSASYRPQSTSQIPNNATSNAANQSGVGMMMTASNSMSVPPHQIHPQYFPHPQAQAPPYTSNTIASNTANTVSQMSSETAKTKCKNFLSFLLELSAKQSQAVAKNVKNLIQGLIDGKVNEESFADRLQKEVNSQPQPCLVGFLKKSLPHLRHSLATSELKIEGIKPPPLSTFVPPLPAPPPVSALVPQTPPPPTERKPSKGSSSKSKSNSSSNSSAAGAASASSGPLTPSSKSSIPATSKSSKEKEKKDKTFLSSGYSADDDINDVAAMGGVNLAEESQRILGSTEFVGTQIRSCRDETMIQASPIIAKFKVIAARYGLDESPSTELSALLSHAVEERLKTMVEKLSVIAEHRMDVIKLDERYEVTQDVKGQLRFLEELDKLEKKRHDEQEREMLIRAAKSRSKSEDPEQAKLKAKAKEMQRVQLEEMRQRDANLTALQAIGPRKKPKLDTAGGSHGSAMPSPLGASGASSSLSRPQMPLRPRLKRVNLRDLLFLLEHDKETMRSPFLYKNLLLK